MPVVFDQPVQTLVEFMDLHQFKTGTRKITHCAFLIPVTVETPFALWIDEAVAAQSLGDEIPAGAFTARQQLLCPEFVETQLLIQRDCQPACTPLPGPTQFHIFESDLHHLPVVDLNCAIPGEESRPRILRWFCAMTHAEMRLSLRGRTPVFERPVHRLPGGSPPRSSTGAPCRPFCGSCSVSSARYPEKGVGLHENSQDAPFCERG
jgi:hypothetical protein